MKTPTVSILTTIYNREAFLPDCIESILKSTFQNWELILVDDKSTDKSRAIANTYVQKDARIKLYENAQNIGDYPNRNMAASYATGTYLKYLDADDIIYPHSLQIMVDALDQFPNAAMALSHNVIDDNTPYPHEIPPAEAIKSFFIGKNVLGVGPSAAIIKKSVFDELGGFSGKPYLGDSELWLKIASRYPIVKLAPSLVWWRQHKDQESVKEELNSDIKKARFQHKIETLFTLKDRLTQTEFNTFMRFTKYRYARDFLNLFFLQKKPSKALRIINIPEISKIDILKALVPFGTKMSRQ